MVTSLHNHVYFFFWKRGIKTTGNRNAGQAKYRIGERLVEAETEAKTERIYIAYRSKWFQIWCKTITTCGAKSKNNFLIIPIKQLGN